MVNLSEWMRRQVDRNRTKVCPHTPHVWLPVPHCPCPCALPCLVPCIHCLVPCTSLWLPCIYFCALPCALPCSYLLTFLPWLDGWFGWLGPLPYLVVYLLHFVFLYLCCTLPYPFTLPVVCLFPFCYFITHCLPLLPHPHPFAQHFTLLPCLIYCFSLILQWWWWWQCVCDDRGSDRGRHFALQFGRGTQAGGRNAFDTLLRICPFGDVCGVMGMAEKLVMVWWGEATCRAVCSLAWQWQCGPGSSWLKQAVGGFESCTLAGSK